MVVWKRHDRFRICRPKFVSESLVAEVVRLAVARVPAEVEVLAAVEVSAAVDREVILDGDRVAVIPAAVEVDGEDDPIRKRQ